MSSFFFRDDTRFAIYWRISICRHDLVAVSKKEKSHRKMPEDKLTNRVLSGVVQQWRDTHETHDLITGQINVMKACSA